MHFKRILFMGDIFNWERVSTVDGVIGISDEYKNLLKVSYYQKEYFIDCSTTDGRIKAYNKCDVLRTVLGKSSSAIANLKVWALDEDGRVVKSRKAKEIIGKGLMRPNPKEGF